MKKFLSILLALALVLSLGTVAFATGGEPYTDHETVTLTKNYKLTNNGTTSPAEIFTFENLTCTSVTDAADNMNTGSAPMPTIGTVDFVEGAAGNGDKMTGTVTITLPTYTSVGIYTYTFNEVNRGTAGVTYRSEPITLKVTVLQGENGLIRIPAIHAETDEGKIDSFDNTYSASSLSVTKKVTGNMGDKQKDFNVTVTFTAPEGETVMGDITCVNADGSESTIEGNWDDTKEVSITLKHEDTVTFKNIPYGVTYTVVEDDYTTTETGGYDEAKYEYSDDLGKKIDSTDTDTVTITNNKDTDVIDTGVFMDSLPYVLLLVGACVGLVVFFARRRMTHKG